MPTLSSNDDKICFGEVFHGVLQTCYKPATNRASDRDYKRELFEICSKFALLQIGYCYKSDTPRICFYNPTSSVKYKTIYQHLRHIFNEMIDLL